MIANPKTVSTHPSRGRSKLRRGRGLLGSTLALLLSCATPAQQQPMPVLILPTADAVSSDMIVLLAENQNEQQTPFDIQRVLFELSRDGESWSAIDERTDLNFELQKGDVTTWDTVLDTVDLAPGEHLVRVTMETTAGVSATSKPTPFVVNKKPAVAVFVRPGPGRADVVFDARESSDPEGEPLSVAWDFGDGTTDSGTAVTHTYQDLSQTYDVLVTVTDAQQATASELYSLAFPKGSITELVFDQKRECVCTKVQLRGDNLPAEAAAFGPDAAPGGTDWPKTAGFDDGKKLGPVHDNPENASFPGGEKKNTSYAFEVYFEVRGLASQCKEGQLIKRTAVVKDPAINRARCVASGGVWNAADSSCALSKTNELDKLDKDQDGTVDLDVSTRAKCVAEGGTWNAAKMKCKVSFPQSGAKYGSDDYRAPSTFKKRPGNKIVFYDTPVYRGLSNATTGTYKAEFVAYVRGTDGKYCYTCFSLDLEKKAGKDKETISEKESKVGADKLPDKVK